MSPPRMIVQLTEAELDKKLEMIVAELLALRSAPAPALLDRQALARMLGCSSKHVDRLRREGMPEVPLGDVPRFELAEVLRWCRSRRLRIVKGTE
jgi:hypothetical protein